MISICIPAYFMNGHGPVMISQLLNTIRLQETKYEYEVVISDSDETGKIKEVCDRFWMLPIRHERSDKKTAVTNINNAIDLAKYDLIKLMCMDDVFAQTNSINLFVEALQKNNWVISNSVRIQGNGQIYSRQIAVYNHGNFTKNTVGMPSVVGWKKCGLRFNENFNTIQDMFFYHELYKLYGQPGYIKEYSIGQRFWAGSLSHTQPRRHKEEVDLLIKNKML